MTRPELPRTKYSNLFYGSDRIECWSILFFFSSRRRHTRCNCDWSSDVCSSDLYPAQSEQNRGTFFEVMRRYLLERATAAGYEAIDLDRFFLPRYAKTGERFEFPND